MGKRNEPAIETVEALEASKHWIELLDQVSTQGKRVVVAKRGTPIAALISSADLAHFQQLEAERDADFAILDEFAEAFRGVPAAEIEREAARALADVRAEDRATRDS